MKITPILIAFLIVLCVPIRTMAAGLGAPWTSYFGAQDSRVPWAETVRGTGRGSTGLALLRGAGDLDMGQGSRFAALEKELVQLLGSRDVIIPVGGLLAARDQDQVNQYMDMIRLDGGKQWEELVARQAVRLAKLSPHGEKIYWQIGNEINSVHYMTALGRWSGKSAVVPQHDDSSVLPLYVEYFLAPTVEGLTAASREAFGSEKKINIVLGTIAGAGRPSSRKWLDELLSYRIKGDFAKSLQGRRVADVINIIGIHYLVSADRTPWQEALDDLDRKWMGQGSVTGIWATEELGAKLAQAGLGAAAALRVAARYLHWWGVHSYTPKQGRCNFWGWQIGPAGTTAQESMQTLYNFLGDAPLTELSQSVLPEMDPRVEMYAFQSKSDPSKRVIIAISGANKEPVTTRGLTMKALGWQGTVGGTLHVFSAGGHEQQPLTARWDRDAYVLSAPNGITVGKRSAALLLLSRNGG